LRADLKVPAYSIPEDATDLRPIPGDGQTDVTGWVSLGRSFPDVRLYALTEWGYRWRGNRTLRGEQLTYLDTWVTNSQVGWFFTPRAVLAASVRHALPLGRDDISRGEVFGGVSVFVPFGQRGLAVEAGFDAPLWTRNGARGSFSTVGVSWQR
jgi:hypothetical protein